MRLPLPVCRGLGRRRLDFSGLEVGPEGLHSHGQPATDPEIGTQLAAQKGLSDRARGELQDVREVVYEEKDCALKSGEMLISTFVG